MSRNTILRTACVAAFAVIASSHHASAEITTWNAYSDFYLTPTASGWGGATSPSVTGSAWGYYMGNVNGFGFPLQIGSYFTTSNSGSGSQNLYQYSSYSPLGSGAFLGTSLWDPTGGAGFPRYADNQSWGSSLGRYDNPWFPGAPGLNNAMWLQAGWLGGGSSEGIAPVLSWTAPATGEYTVTGLFVAGDQGANGASVAIVDSLGGSPIVSRTTLASTGSNAFSFTKSYSAGDVIQFQVGSNFTTGNAIGLQVSIQAVPEPSTVMLVASAAVCGIAGIRRSRRR